MWLLLFFASLFLTVRWFGLQSDRAISWSSLLAFGIKRNEIKHVIGQYQPVLYTHYH